MSNQTNIVSGSFTFHWDTANPEAVLTALNLSPSVPVPPKWVFYQGRDSWDGVSQDPQVVGSVDELKAHAISVGAVGFNTNGYVKNTLVQPFLYEPTFSGADQGLWVLQNGALLPPVQPPTTTGRTILAPYICGWHLGNNSDYKISNMMQAHSRLGCKNLTWAFVKDDVSAVTNAVVADFNAFRSVGGRVIISFGGANGPYIEENRTEDQCYSQIDSLLQRTGVRAVDFDIEGERLLNQQSNDRRNKVIARLQRKYPDLYVSFTLPAGVNGLDNNGASLLRNAVSNNVRTDIVNIMTMDYYDPASARVWGQTACNSGDRTVNTLASIFPGKTREQLYRMLGITVMIGVNDDNSVFSLADTRQVAEYAKRNNIGLVSFWSLERDQTGTSGDLGVRSRVNVADYEFYRALESATL